MMENKPIADSKPENALPIMDAITVELSTSIGQSSLKIKAVLDNTKLKIAGKNAMQYLVWHSLPSKAFDKTSQFKRNSEFSEALKLHLEKTAKTVLENCFSNIEIEIEKFIETPKAEIDYGKLSDEQKAKIREAVMAELQAEAKPVTPEATTKA